jgi:hypothetical protein
MKRLLGARRLAAALALVTLVGCPPPSPPAPPAPPGGGGQPPPPPAGTDPMTPPPPGTDGQPTGPSAPAPAEVKPLAPDALAPVDEPTVKAWVGPALAQPAAAFKPIEQADREKLLSAPLEESSGAASFFLNPDVDPYRGAKGGVWTVRRAPDLIRCQYRAGELACVLTEGANFLCLEVTPKDALTPASLRKLVKRVAQLEVKSDGIGQDRSWKVEVPDGVDLSKGAHRFGNPGAPPVLLVASRDDRIDVLVADGRVFVVFYKKIEQLVGFGPDDWLDPAARKKLTGR